MKTVIPAFPGFYCLDPVREVITDELVTYDATPIIAWVVELIGESTFTSPVCVESAANDGVIQYPDGRVFAGDTIYNNVGEWIGSLK